MKLHFFRQHPYLAKVVKFAVENVVRNCEEYVKFAIVPGLFLGFAGVVIYKLNFRFT